jgi:hypothetical protein
MSRYSRRSAVVPSAKDRQLKIRQPKPVQQQQKYQAGYQQRSYSEHSHAIPADGNQSGEFCF